MARAIEVTRQDMSAAALRRHALRCRDGRVACRVLAIAHVLEGASRAAAASACGMDRQTLRDWVHRYNAEGIEGLKSRRSPGAAPRLTAAQRAELKTLVLQGPDPAVHKVVRWRCQDLRAEVTRRFAVTVHELSLIHI